jgi:peptidoglycan/xylan/chitin deacetylase (PgdA/CDA1 family)
MILEELNRRGLKGIFFVNGHHITRNRPEDLARRNLLRKLALHGHLVGNHGLSHRNLCQERELMAKEIDGSAELVTYATGVRPLLFRSPYGARCRALDQALKEREVVQVGWNLDPQEWKGGTEEAIVTYVSRELRKIQGPVILLLHDKNMAAVRALPRILDFIEAENRNGLVPIRVVDYRVFLPEKPLREVGLTSLVQSMAAAFSAFDSIGNHRQ